MPFKLHLISHKTLVHFLNQNYAVKENLTNTKLRASWTKLSVLSYSKGRLITGQNKEKSGQFLLTLTLSAPLTYSLLVQEPGALLVRLEGYSDMCPCTGARCWLFLMLVPLASSNGIHWRLYCLLPEGETHYI